MALYLLHFSSPLGDPTRRGASASHYLGWAPDGHVLERVREHQTGKGAKITCAAVARGINLLLVAVAEGDRNEERRRKNAGHHERHCPVCNPKVTRQGGIR